MKLKILLMGILLSLFLTGCADVSNIDSCVDSSPYGFLGGIWHGCIIVFSFVGSLFSDDIAIYAVNNNGGWYDLGFLIGTGILTSFIKELKK